MSLTLILMRHAKSSWDDPLAEDFDRTLNGRGRKAAVTMAKWLVEKGYLPDIVLVSTARRTVETWERMAPIMPETATMESSPALYLAGPDILLGALKSQKAPVAMMIAHNPGIADFAEGIVKKPPKHPDFLRYPTAATCVMEFSQESWEDVTWGTGETLDFAVPKDFKS